jgi:L-ascorbate 6-phosphate lactonase
MNGEGLFDPGLSYPRTVERTVGSREFMASIRARAVPEGKTAVWFLGQNGFVLKSGNAVLAIDPYLSDYCAARRDDGVRTPKSRMLPVFIDPADFAVDAVLLTHSHADHADPVTLSRLPNAASCLFYAPYQAVSVLRDAGIPDSRVVLMHPRQRETFQGIEIIGSFAEPTDSTDLNHMGYILRFPGGFTYWNSGDTAKSGLLSYVKEYQVDLASICINGGYHNLSHWEAAEVAAAVGPAVAVPCHYDMFPHNFQSPLMFRKSLSTLAPDVRYLEMDYYTAYEF